MSVIGGRGPVCPMCNKVAIQLVPMQDSDQAHTGQMACVTCKRKIRANLPIIKFKRGDDKSENS